MGTLILSPLVFSTLLICLVVSESITSKAISRQDLREQQLEDELFSLLEAASSDVKKRASHGKGPAPVTRVLNQVKISKAADTRRGNKDRGGSKSGGSSQHLTEDDRDDDFVVESTTPEVSSSGSGTYSKSTTWEERSAPSVSVPDKSGSHHYQPTTAAVPGSIPGSVDGSRLGSGPKSKGGGSESAPPSTPITYLPLLTPRHLRLQKLDFYFNQLGVNSEDCRKRLLCEVAENQATFQPLSFVFQEETSFDGEYQHVTSEMMNTTEGARLLSYMEASLNGQDRRRGCSALQYRCPSTARDMINFEALVLWREMIRWLSVQVVAQHPPAP